MESKAPKPDEYCRFMIDGVKYKDIKQFDELSALVSSRSMPEARKDAFYFSLFHLRSVNDIVVAIMQKVDEKIEEKVRPLEKEVQELREKVAALESVKHE